MRGRMNAARLAAVLACSLALASCEYITAQTITDNGQNQSQGQGQFQGQGQGRTGAAPGANGVQDRNGGTGAETRNGVQSRSGGAQTGP
ncbi:MAG: hypothetical protein K0Q90_2751 [Paenibacillaceae bacterium]|jgi:hypothetical protein|nr:hypothetical protein [Paenibacillaceae bacterium]